MERYYDTPMAFGSVDTTINQLLDTDVVELSVGQDDRPQGLVYLGTSVPELKTLPTLQASARDLSIQSPPFRTYEKASHEDFVFSRRHFCGGSESKESTRTCQHIGESSQRWVSSSTGKRVGSGRVQPKMAKQRTILESTVEADSKVLRKFQEDQAKSAILVTSYWPTQRWCPMTMRHSKTRQLILKFTKRFSMIA
ncbi:hypothetical protein O0I10_006719 [Lichtheimia ornata]|uniref:Uncharacterized protein n=1 Tax=Lichtheimia ornata TaxID=688661 RepID=A0AAD7XYH7_9FUNG|nr:uncharacterized protein O0I10_006719 [Lichtheimia ornata]KAJ8657653.1 hypothetical protein O0I10_006719 [Lichtheimia ornata]